MKNHVYHVKIILLMLKKLAKILIDKNMTISTAESCTGGLVSSMLTDISGSSAFVKLNFVTYSNEAKHEILGVSLETLENFGAVSEQCAREMAQGLYKKTHCDIAICLTGIAGPTGGTKDKPIGLCYISCMYKNSIYINKLLLNPQIKRKEMKRQFAKNAIEFAYKILTTY